MKTTLKPLAIIFFILFFTILSYSQVLMFDDFSGTIINNSKWSIYNGPRGGSITQNNKIFWNNAGTIGHTGHGLTTVMNFSNGGRYIIEADYEVDDIYKSEGEGGTGINITRINSGRESTYYGQPLNSIVVSFWGNISYIGDSWGENFGLTTKNSITPSQKPSGIHNDIFYFLNSKTVHLKIEIDTDNRTIKCWANNQTETYSEGFFSAAIWDKILNGTNNFKIEEFRSWGDPFSNYCQHRLDNWSISQISGQDFPPISPSGASEVYPGDEFWLDINVGSATQPVNNLKVVSFELLYTNTSIIDYVAHEVGTFLTNAQATVIPDDQNGKISVSVYRTTGGNSGHGVVIRLKFKITTNAYEGQEVNFSFSSVLANDTNGQTINLSPGTHKLMIRNSVLVWPGDANNDGIVNIFDINPIVSMYWSNGGPQRSNASINWYAQPCPPWNPRNATYCDCNGDGIVSIIDINPVIVNFGKTHTSLLLSINQSGIFQSNMLNPAYNSNDPKIKILVPLKINKNSDFFINIEIGSTDLPVNNLKVVSFELFYTNHEKIKYLDYEMGSFLTNAQATVISDDSCGKISASVYRTEGSNSGSGIVLKLKYKNLDFPTDTITFYFGQIQANAEDGSPINLLPDSAKTITKVERDKKMSLLFSLSQNYPNPFNPITKINYSIPASGHVEISIFNALGQKIKTIVSENETAGHHITYWDATDEWGHKVVSGIYYYKIKSEGFTQIKKMILVK